jgi:hypothetical protein
LVSVQPAEHEVSPVGQLLHFPATHMPPEGHALPHIPQLALSVWVLTQEPEHSLFPPVQVVPSSPPPPASGFWTD